MFEETIVVRTVSADWQSPPFTPTQPGSFWHGGYEYQYVARHLVGGGHAYVAVHSCSPGRQEFHVGDPKWGAIGNPRAWVTPPKYSSRKILDSRPGSGFDNTFREVMKYPVDLERQL